MTIIETATKALTAQAAQILLSKDKKHAEVKTKSKTYFLQKPNPKEQSSSKVQENLMMPLRLSHNITYCEGNQQNPQPLQITQMSDNSFVFSEVFGDMSKTPEKYQNFTQFLRDNFEKNQNIHTVYLKIQDNFFSVGYQDTGSPPQSHLKKIYDISNDELRINNTEGICYRHKINGKYIRLKHLEECPNISILQTGDNQYVLFPSKSYIEEKKADHTNTNHSFKEAVLNNTPQDQKMIKELFYVISQRATKDSDIKIIDTQTKNNNTSFRVSIA